MNNVLSISGGGIRGALPLTWLVELEEETGKSCRELFQFLVGNSTGSIIILGLSLGFPAKALLKFYTEKGDYIFKKDRFRKLLTLGNITKAKYDEKYLEEVLDYYFKDGCLLDGGIYINNPSMSALVSSIRMFGEDEEINLISLGCGEISNKFNAKKLKNFSSIDWLKNIVPMMMDGQNKAVHYQLKEMYNKINGTYEKVEFKLSPELSSMDNGSKENVNKLIDVSKRYLCENKKQFNRIIDVIG